MHHLRTGLDEIINSNICRYIGRIAERGLSMTIMRAKKILLVTLLLIFSLSSCQKVAYRENTVHKEGESINNQINIYYEGQIELTGDANQERISISASGPEWRNLKVRFEIYSDIDSLLFADEWSSAYWFAGVRNITIQRIGGDDEWVKHWMNKNLSPSNIDNDYSRIIIENMHATIYRRFIRMYLGEQRWKIDDNRPAYDHFISQDKNNRKLTHYMREIKEEEIDQLIMKLTNSPSFIYKPHYTMSYAIVWYQQDNRFIIAGVHSESRY